MAAQHIPSSPSIVEGCSRDVQRNAKGSPEHVVSVSATGCIKCIRWFSPMVP